MLAFGMYRPYLELLPQSQSSFELTPPKGGSVTTGFVTPADHLSYQIASSTDLVLKMVAKGLILIQILHMSSAADISCYLSRFQSPAQPLNFPITISSPAASLIQSGFDACQRKLGFTWLGLSNSDPISLWPIYNKGGPSTRTPRPMSIQILISLTNHLFALRIRETRSSCLSTLLQLATEHLRAFINQVQPPTNLRSPAWPRLYYTLSPEPFTFDRHFSLNGRGHLSILMSNPLVWLGNNSFPDRVYNDCCVAWSENLSGRLLVVPDFCLNISTICRLRYISSTGRGLALKKKDILRISSIMERSFTSSSLCEERTFPPLSLFTRGDCSPASKPENPFNTLTVLFSSVMAHSVPVEKTVIICVRSEVLVLSKSFGIMTTLWLVDEFVLKFRVEFFSSSPNNLSNFVKFVSLPLTYGCIKAFAVWLLCRVCPIMNKYNVPF